MPEPYFPLRWESTGDQWWYASPIDWAAANGHYDLVRELLHIDANLLIKLTSLRRIRRLETVWDDDKRFADAAQCRSHVARNLLLECEMKNGKNTLIRAGYGGWLLYTAAAAGDISFVKELLERDPLMVFGEGEYGVTDILYAAARSRNSEVFRLLFEYVVTRYCPGGSSEGGEPAPGGNVAVFRWEMVSRAIHAAARGGNLEILRGLLGVHSDVLAYRDLQGATVLHAAAARGQVEVVKDLVASFDIINSRDNHGNTPLHIAAFRGHLPVVKTLIEASPSSSSQTNNNGDTFLHMAVAGFRTPGFRRLDRQLNLVKQLVIGNIIDVTKVINARNNEGRTSLHTAVIGSMHPDLVELLMTVKTIDLNIHDADGLTPLDHLRQRPRSASSEILIKQLISAGGISNSRDHKTRSAIVSQLKLQGLGSSPGTSFRISDAEIFLYTGNEASEITPEKDSGRPSSCSSSQFESIDENPEYAENKKKSSVNRAAKHLKILLTWPLRKDKKFETPKKSVNDSVHPVKKWSDLEDTPTPLRQRFSQGPSLVNSKRTLAVRNPVPSPAAKKKFTAGLMHGVIQSMPYLSSDDLEKTPPTKSSKSSDEHLAVCQQEKEASNTFFPNSSPDDQAKENVPHKSGFINTKMMNHYLCFGAQGLATGGPVKGGRSNRLFKRSVLSAA